MSLSGQMMICQLPMPQPRQRQTHGYPQLKRRNDNYALALWWVILAAMVQVIVASVSLREEITKDPLLRHTTDFRTVHLKHERRDQSDPCTQLLEVANTCLQSPLANPTCGTCVGEAFDMFLSSTTENFTCTDFEMGVCPIVYQNCLCTPCNTELESYFSCLLNDARDNECPVAYCDPLKDFSLTPAACLEDLAFASACIGSDCLQCLGEMIDAGATCDIYGQQTCDAVNIDCLSCLNCKDNVEPWLRCIAVEGKACDNVQCVPTPSPLTTPSLQQPIVPTVRAPAPPTASTSTSPSSNVTTPTIPTVRLPSPSTTTNTTLAPILSNETTTSPTSTPQSSIVATPTAPPTAAPMSPILAGTTRDISSSSLSISVFSRKYRTHLIVISISYVLILIQ